MEKNKSFRDVIQVALSNIFKLLSGVLVAFLLPKAIGISDYGYYKTFTLYATYVGLFHFGFLDGIYLKYGGKNYEDLNKSKFRLFTRTMLILEIIISAIAGFCFLLLLEGELKFIFICLSVFLLVNNMTGYYQIISQITSRFKELSIRTIIQSLLTCLGVCVVWILNVINSGNVSYRIFTIIFVGITFLLSLWYIWTYREITFGKRDGFRTNIKLLLSFFVSGIPLLVSNLCQTLLITLDRQFVNMLFDTDTYAVYAFAYNMLALITTALSAISTVIYPILKKSNEDNLKSSYSKLIEFILILVFLCLVVYFPLELFVEWFLPKYTDSLPIFRVILPGMAISSAITIGMHNYYKTFDKEKEFFFKSIIILLLAIGANAFAYYLFHTTISISIASIVVMVIWYLVIEEHFIREFKCKWIKNFLYMILMTFLFYAITFIDIWWFALISYIVVFVVVSLCFYLKDIKGLLLRFNKSNTY